MLRCSMLDAAAAIFTLFRRYDAADYVDMSPLLLTWYAELNTGWRCDARFACLMSHATATPDVSFASMMLLSSLPSSISPLPLLLIH